MPIADTIAAGAAVYYTVSAVLTRLLIANAITTTWQSTSIVASSRVLTKGAWVTHLSMGSVGNAITTTTGAVGITKQLIVDS